MLFRAELSDVKIVYNVLKAISFKEDGSETILIVCWNRPIMFAVWKSVEQQQRQLGRAIEAIIERHSAYATLRPMEEGLKVTLEEMRCVEASAYIPCNIFTYYRIDSSQDVIFRVSIKNVTECLNILGEDVNPSMKLSYKAVGSPLSLVIKHPEENITIDCEISTVNVDDFSDISLGEECNLNKLVINANFLLEMFQRLDNYADDLTVTTSPDPPYFKLSTTGVGGESEVVIPKQSEYITIFQCEKSITSQYKFSNIRQILKVMGYANKVAVSTGESNLLGLQLVIISDDKQMYVEYYIASQYSE